MAPSSAPSNSPTKTPSSQPSLSPTTSPSTFPSFAFYFEYPHAENDETGAGLISNCAFVAEQIVDGQSASGGRFQKVRFDTSRTGEQAMTQIHANILKKKTEVTGRLGKDRPQRNDNGLPYFYVSGQPFYVDYINGPCNPIDQFDLYAVLKGGDRDSLMLPNKFRGGDVEKFTSQELGNIFYPNGQTLKARPWQNLTPEQKQLVSALDGAAILANLKCQVKPQPFRFAGTDSKPWKKRPVGAESLPNGWQESTQVEHCMTFSLDIV